MNKKLWSKIKKKLRLWMRLKRMNEVGENNTRKYCMVDVEYCQINHQVGRETRREVKLNEKVIAKNVKSNPKIFWKYVR